MPAPQDRSRLVDGRHDGIAALVGGLDDDLLLVGGVGYPRNETLRALPNQFGALGRTDRFGGGVAFVSGIEDRRRLRSDDIAVGAARRTQVGERLSPCVTRTSRVMLRSPSPAVTVTVAVGRAASASFASADTVNLPSASVTSHHVSFDNAVQLPRLVDTATSTLPDRQGRSRYRASTSIRDRASARRRRCTMRKALEPANNAAAPLMNLSFSIGIKFMKFAALSQCGRIYEIYIVKPYRRREDATRPKGEQTALSRGFNVDFDGKNSFFCVFIINLHTIR